MRICHVVESMDPQDGGPPSVAAHLAAEQARLGLAPLVISPATDDWRHRVVPFLEAAVGGHNLSLFRECSARRIPSRPDTMSVAEAVMASDVVHCHGVWSGIGYRAARTARRSGRPYVVRPAGMLEPWSLRQKKWKKRAALLLGYRHMLRHAAALHATSTGEAAQLRRLGFCGPVAVIANGITIQLFDRAPDPTSILRNWPELSGRRWLLFLSRLHPKKGLLELAQCWGELYRVFEDWHLVIAGPGSDAEYRARVEDELRRSGAARHATFVGPVFDEMKAQLMLNSGLFVLPTYSENFGIVIGEALAARLAVLTTDQTPWGLLHDEDCGWWIPPGRAPLLAALASALAMDATRRGEMGRRGREVVASQFAWPAVARRTGELYRWLLDGGERPDFIIAAGADVHEWFPPRAGRRTEDHDAAPERAPEIERASDGQTS